MELRVAKLEEEMAAVKQQVGSITEDIHGTAMQPGVFEQLRTLQTTEEHTQFLVKQTSEAVTSFKGDQLKVKGMLIAAGTIAGCLGWIVNFVLNYIKATNGH